MNEQITPAASVEASERERIAAMVAGDIGKLDQLLHEDLIFGHTNGLYDDKATYLNKFRAGTVRYADPIHQIVKVVVRGDAALVRVHLKMRAELKDRSIPLNVLALTVWSLEQGRWRMVAHQPTTVDFEPLA
jgi:ketosteroid isomerase-like protein